jgi:3D (Asp-Asp-Asp) domain-containing protein
VKRGDVIRTVVAACIATLFVVTGVAKLPTRDDPVLRHPPVIVYSDPMVAPLIVTAKKILQQPGKLFERAPVGKMIPVSLTQYCLRGTTRRDHYVRPGIVAADPRLFPLARYVEVFLGKRYLGRFLVDDTGKNVKGATLDIWTPSCAEARRFGRQKGAAVLVAR